MRRSEPHLPNERTGQCVLRVSEPVRDVEVIIASSLHVFAGEP